LNAIEKPLPGINNVHTKQFKGFGSGFTETRGKLDVARCLIWPSITDKAKHKFEKVLYEDGARSQHSVSHGRLMQ
jgi:hypothetical protein